MRVDLTFDQVQAAIDDPDDGIMTLQETARLCGVTLSAVQDWVRRGVLAATVVNGRSWVVYSHVVAVEKRMKDSPYGQGRRHGRPTRR